MTQSVAGIGFVAGLALLLSHAAPAQEAADVADPRLGTIASPEGTAIGEAPDVADASIGPANTFKKAQYATGGIGLRNIGTGTVHISGVTGRVQGAFLYWAVITQGAAGAADKSVTLTRTFPAGGHSVTVAGTLLGTGATPCWPNTNTISAFKASVPVAEVTGNGAYEIAFTKEGASGSTKGEDPWVAHVPPLLEGASLVVVGTGTGTVYLFDKGFAGKTFGNHTVPETFSYTLTLPAAATGGQVLFDSIGADGQIGTSRTAGNVANDQPLLAAKATEINSQLVAGPFSASYIDFDSDWNGNAGAPLPRLWDDVGHDVTAAVSAGTRTLKMSIVTEGDCLTPVANVFGVF